MLVSNRLSFSGLARGQQIVEWSTTWKSEQGKTCCLTDHNKVNWNSQGHEHNDEGSTNDVSARAQCHVNQCIRNEIVTPIKKLEAPGPVATSVLQRPLVKFPKFHFLDVGIRIDKAHSTCKVHATVPTPKFKREQVKQSEKTMKSNQLTDTTATHETAHGERNGNMLYLDVHKSWTEEWLIWRTLDCFVEDWVSTSDEQNVLKWVNRKRTQ